MLDPHHSPLLPQTPLAASLLHRAPRNPSPHGSLPWKLIGRIAPSPLHIGAGDEQDKSETKPDRIQPFKLKKLLDSE